MKEKTRSVREKMVGISYRSYIFMLKLKIIIKKSEYTQRGFRGYKIMDVLTLY